MPVIRNVLRELRGRSSSVLATLKLVWEPAPGYTVAWIALTVAQGITPLVLVIGTRWFVDELTAAIRAGTPLAQSTPLVFSALLIGGALILTEILQSIGDWIRTAQAELLQTHVTALVHRHAILANLAAFEQPEFLDRLELARSEIATRPLVLLENTGACLQSAITVVTLGAALAQYGMGLALWLLLSGIPACAVMLRCHLQAHDWHRRTAPGRRRLQYFDRLLTEPANAAELRLFELGSRFSNAYSHLRSQLVGARVALLRAQFVWRLFGSLLTLALCGVPIAILAYRALARTTGFGDVAALIQIFYRIQVAVRALLTSGGQVYANSLFAEDLLEFLRTPEGLPEPAGPNPVPQTLRHGITLEQVSFVYSGSAEPALQDVSLTIPVGKVTAIVGPNGAGKSTLLRLLCRFYDPSSGRIRWDGADIRGFESVKFRRNVTGLFQNPVRYQETAAVNIALAAQPAPELSEDRVQGLALASGAHACISRLPRGYQTTLGKAFEGGSELSAGEWQQVAFARAFARDATLVLADEPTTFMDPCSEANWFQRFRELRSGKTAVLVTHRLSVAMKADHICVLDGGRLVESGTHSSLIARNGVYAAMWTAQVSDQADIRKEAIA